MLKIVLFHKRIAVILPYIISFLFTVGIYQIHMTENVDSMLNENNTELSTIFLKSQINYHKELTPFARRPLTTWLVESTSKIIGIELGHAFVWVNFSLLFINGLLMYFLSYRLGARRRDGLLNLCVYFLTFSVLFSFFPPVFSYDEPLQYFFILLALIALESQKWLWYILSLLPGLFLLVSDRKKIVFEVTNNGRYLKYIRLLLPLFLYGIFLTFFLSKNELWEATKMEMTSRFSCFLENFENPKNSLESVTSFFLTVGPFLYLTLFYVTVNKKMKLEQKYIRAFMVTLILNTPLVLLTSFARESRLFALPLLFLWPVFSQVFRKELSMLFSSNMYSLWVKKSRFILSFLALTILNYLFAYKVYEKLGLGENNYFSEYLFMSIFLITLHGTLSYFVRAHPGRKSG